MLCAERNLFGDSSTKWAQRQCREKNAASRAFAGARRGAEIAPGGWSVFGQIPFSFGNACRTCLASGEGSPIVHGRRDGDRFAPPEEEGVDLPPPCDASRMQLGNAPHFVQETALQHPGGRPKICLPRPGLVPSAHAVRRNVCHKLFS